MRQNACYCCFMSDNIGCVGCDITPGVLRGVRPLLCPWTQNFVDCFLFCCALESSCLGRLSAIKVQLELELELSIVHLHCHIENPSIVDTGFEGLNGR